MVVSAAGSKLVGVGFFFFGVGVFVWGWLFDNFGVFIPACSWGLAFLFLWGVWGGSSFFMLGVVGWWLLGCAKL